MKKDYHLNQCEEIAGRISKKLNGAQFSLFLLEILLTGGYFYHIWPMCNNIKATGIGYSVPKENRF